jgi:ketosteroid isomerase-like protein
MNIEDRIRNLFIAIDSKVTSDFVSYLTQDCVFIFGNAPAVNGKDEIFNAVDGFYRSIADLTHKVENTIISGDNVVSYGDVKYIRLDGNIVPANFCNVFKMEGDLIKKYQIYVDISQLYA